MKEGMKQTEIGVLPQDWSLRQIKQFATIKTGTRNTQDRVIDGEYPFFVRSQTVERIDSFSYDGEAILTAGDGVGVGKVIHYIKGKFDFHQRVYCITGFSPEIHGKYFFKYFESNFLNRIMQMTAKSSVDSVRMDMIAEMQIPVPLFSEQEAIAEALSDADAWIESLETLIEKKRLMKQGAMQELLQPKEGWEVKKIKDFAPLQRGFDLPVSSIVDGIYPVVFSNGVSFYHKDYTVKGPGVVTGRSGTIGNVFYVSDNFWPHNTTLWVTNFLNAHPRYVYYLYQHLNFNKFGTGSGVPTLNRNDIHHFEIAVPNLDEQELIAATLSDIDTGIETLQQKLSKARQIKQGMMQQLLTGKIRLVRPANGKTAKTLKRVTA